MTNAIQWKMPDGSIRITYPAGENADLDQIAAKLQSEHPEIATATRLSDVDPAVDLPQSRRFRSCWRADGSGKPRVDMPLARVQRLNEIRAERNEKLRTSDGPMARENEIGTTGSAQAMKDYRQALRDLPNNLVDGGTLDAINTPEELEVFDPTWPTAPIL